MQDEVEYVGIVAANHVSYVGMVLDVLEAGSAAVLLPSAEDAQRYPTVTPARLLTPRADGGGWYSRRFQPSSSEAPALVTSTSGTEGRAKAIVISHRALADTVERLNRTMEVDSRIREYVGVPVTHSFGFGRCRAVATAGGSCFVPGAGFSPIEIRRLLEAGEINAISAVPSLWRVVLAQPDVIGRAGKEVRWIEIGSQYMSRAEKEQLVSLFPNAVIVLHYGLTEASRSTMLRIDQTRGDALESVGRAVGAAEVHITAEGRIAVRGPHLASGYLTEAGRQTLTDDDGWFVTKDLGRLEDGFLYYEGRADDVINSGGIKVQPELLEMRLREMLGTTDGFAVVRRRDPIRGEAFLGVHEGSANLAPERFRAAIVEALRAFDVQAGNAVVVRAIDTLPRTAAGKIKRRELVRWYEELGPVPEATQEAPQAAPDQSAVARAFCRELGRARVQGDDTYVSLGGDSLTYVQLGMVLEGILGSLPHDWENLPIARLEALDVRGRGATASIETRVLIRALAILGVVINHAEIVTRSHIMGGAYLLLLVAGNNFARFQMPGLSKGLFPKPIASQLRNLIIPYAVFVIAYQLAKRHFEPSVLFMYSCYLSPWLPAPFQVWFIQVLTQLVLATALLFTLTPLRTAATRQPWRFSLGLLAVGLVLASQIPKIWDTTALWDCVPHMVFWCFALGMCIHHTDRLDRKLWTSALLIASVVWILGFRDSRGYWLLLGGLGVLWMDRVKLPFPVARAAQYLAAATYYVYLTHGMVIHNVLKRLGTNLFSSFLGAVLSLAVGIMVWYGIEQAKVIASRRRTSAEEVTA